MDEMLKYAIENGIVDLSYVQEKYEMNKRKEILKKYGTCIWYNEKEDVWYCYLPDETRDDGRKRYKRKKQKDIEDIVCDFYRKVEYRESATLETVFREFFEYKEKLVSANTVKRMIADWNRFYRGHEITRKSVKDLTKVDIDNFFNETLNANSLKAKAFHNMCGILKQMLEYMVDAGYIEANPYRIKVNRKKFAADGKKSSQTEVYQTGEKELLIQEMERRLANNPSNTAPLAVMLDFEIGARKGEMLALNEGDIADGWIHIHRQVVEMFDASDIRNIRSRGFEVVDYTKSEDGDRWVPLSRRAMEIIRRICETNRAYGNELDGYLFVSKGKIMGPDAVDTQILRGCKHIGIPVKTMHKIRKTYGSSLLHNGVNLSAVKDMLGHADESTTLKHYIFNTMNDKETGEQVLRALGDFESHGTTMGPKVVQFYKREKAENPSKIRDFSL